jgi:hypothetical protein
MLRVCCNIAAVVGVFCVRMRSGRSSQFGRWGDGDTHWSAVIVENVRIDGRPTQRHIAYLVGFTESWAAVPAQQRFLWDAIKAKLDHLGNRISPQDRKRIEAIMVARIGKPPTKAQRAKLDRRCRQLLGDDWCDEHYGKEFGR